MHKIWLPGVILLIFSSVSAMQITEIMYDPVNESEEWIELYNNGSEVNISGWRVLDPVSHTLDSSAWAIPSSSYAIIAENAESFAVKYNYTGIIFDASSLGLNNDGDWIAINDTITIVENVSYAATVQTQDNTLQLVSGSWCEGNPTPGSTNNCNSEPPPNNSSNNNTNTTNNNTKPEENISVTLVDFPSEVLQGDNFTVTVEIQNNFATAQAVELYSHIYSGQQIYTEGGWTANSETIELAAGELQTLELQNTVKPDAELGTYVLRVRVAIDDERYDETADVEILENTFVETVEEEALMAEAAETAERHSSTKTASTRSTAAAESEGRLLAWKASPTERLLIIFVAVLVVIIAGLLLSFVKPKGNLKSPSAK